MTQTNEPFRHETVLEGLDWTQKGILPDGRLYEHYYPPDEFGKAVTLTDGINIIYASRHPAEVRGKNLEEVLQQVNGKYAGYLSNTMVHNMGNPKFKTVSNVVDSEVEDKIRRGEIAVSFAFKHDPIPAKGSLTGIIPDHVLFYDRKLGIPQGDPIAMVYNQSNSESIIYSQGYFEGENIPEDPAKIDMNLYNELLDFKKNQELITEKESTIMKLNQDVKDREGIITGLKTDIENALEEGKTTSAKLNQDLADLTAKYNQDIEAKDTKIKELETKIETDRVESFKANQEGRWNRLPKGIQDKFTERKSEFFDETASMKLNQDIIDFIATGTTPAVLPVADGDTHQKKQNQGLAQVPIRKFNPSNGKMEDC